MQQQAETAPALFSAIQLIGDADVSEFAFLCHGATHQSVACSLLLAAIAAAYYPRADRYYLTTEERTRRDAYSLGVYVCPIDFASSCFNWQGCANDSSRGGVRGGEGGGGGKGMAAAATQGRGY